MKNIYLPDFGNNDTIKIESMLSDIGVITLGDYPKDNTFEDFENKFDEIANGDKVNLICNSIGCNYGVILSAIRTSQINKLVLMSPRVFKPTLKEQVSTILYSIDCNTFISKEKERKTLADTTNYIKMSNSSRELALKYLKQKFDIKSLIIYGKGDISVSKIGVYKLSTSYDSRIIDYPTTCKDIFSSVYGNDTVQAIEDFINDIPKKRIKI